MPNEIDDYLSVLPEPQRQALQQLRTEIRKALPDATECLSYGLPGFKLTKVVLGFGAGKNHLALYPHSSTITTTFADELKAWKTTKGAIHFQPQAPLPTDLVQRIIEQRLREINGPANPPEDTKKAGEEPA